MIHSVPRLIEFISSIMTLEPGDLILTGTPKGVGPLCAGDHVTAGVVGHAEHDPMSIWSSWSLYVEAEHGMRLPAWGFLG